MLIIFAILTSIHCQYVTTIAGGSTGSQNGQDITASFNEPHGIALDNHGNLYVADCRNNKIRKINSTGYVSNLAGSGAGIIADGQGVNASLYCPSGIFAHSNGNIYFSDSQNQRVRMVNSSGYVGSLAGHGAIGFTDGQGTAASFHYPFGISVDDSENIYVADKFNNLIRIVNSTGYVRTIAGGGSGSFINGQSTIATFNGPTGLAIDSSLNIYVADLYNNVIRKINSSGFVSTYAGSGETTTSDGPALSASFNNPCGLAIDSVGNLFVTGCSDNRIIMITTTGYVRTIAGNGVASFLDGPATDAEFNSPMGVAVDSVGNVLIADTFNNRIRKLDNNYLIYYTPKTSRPMTSVTSTSSTCTMTSDLLSTTATTPSQIQIYTPFASIALITFFTGPIPYAMFLLGSVCGALYARERMKREHEEQLRDTFMKRRSLREQQVRDRNKLYIY